MKTYNEFIYDTGQALNEDLKYNIEPDRSITDRLLLMNYVLDTYENYNPYLCFYGDTDYPNATVLDNIISIVLTTEGGINENYRKGSFSRNSYNQSFQLDTPEYLIVDKFNYLLVDEIVLEQPNEEYFHKVVKRTLHDLANPIGGCNLALKEKKKETCDDMKSFRRCSFNSAFSRFKR